MTRYLSSVIRRGCVTVFPRISFLLWNNFLLSYLRYTQQPQRDWGVGFRLKEIQSQKGILWAIASNWLSGRLSDNLTGYPKMHTIVSMLMYISSCFEEISPTWIFLSLWIALQSLAVVWGSKQRERIVSSELPGQNVQIWFTLNSFHKESLNFWQNEGKFLPGCICFRTTLLKTLSTQRETTCWILLLRIFCWLHF